MYLFQLNCIIGSITTRTILNALGIITQKSFSNAFQWDFSTSSERQFTRHFYSHSSVFLDRISLLDLIQFEINILILGFDFSFTFQVESNFSQLKQHSKRSIAIESKFVGSNEFRKEFSVSQWETFFIRNKSKMRNKIFKRFYWFFFFRLHSFST